MANGAPRKRQDREKSEQTHKAEARRFLGTSMDQAMIRGLGQDENRTKAWLGVANKLYQEGEIGKGTVKNIAEKAKQL